MINNKVDQALCITEQYVDYYLPSDVETMATEQQDGEEGNHDNSQQTGAKERFNIISHKVTYIAAFHGNGYKQE